MKKIYFLLSTFIFITINSFCQGYGEDITPKREKEKKEIQSEQKIEVNKNLKLIITPTGLKNATENEKTFVVIQTDGLTAMQLYENAVKYVNQNYKNPEEVIKGKTEGEYLRFNTFVSTFLIAKNSGVNVLFDATYTTELSFKDGKFKYEIISLEIYTQTGRHPLVYVGGSLEWAIYNKKGELVREEVKEQIETYFNSDIDRITEFLKSGNKKAEW